MRDARCLSRNLLRHAAFLAERDHVMCSGCLAVNQATAARVFGDAEDLTVEVKGALYIVNQQVNVRETVSPDHHDSIPICVSRYRSAFRVSPSRRAAWLLLPSAFLSAWRISSCSY